MPQRFLRPGITASRKWNSLDWFGQSFYIRLITLVDDFGRFEADSLVLRGLCFPLGDMSAQPVDLTTIVRSCEQMFSLGLVVFYKKDGKEFLQVTNWQERARSERSKFPPFDNTCEQMFANVVKCSLPKSSSSSSPAPAPSSRTGLFPANEREAKSAMSVGVAIPEPFIIDTWNKAMSRGGRDSKGLEIASFQHYCLAEWKYERERLFRNGSSESPRRKRNIPNI